jgi:hypothetical protein
MIVLNTHSKTVKIHIELCFSNVAKDFATKLHRKIAKLNYNSKTSP